MGQLFVVVEAAVRFGKPNSLVPAHAVFFPVCRTTSFRCRAEQILHFHLLELAHAEDELPGHDLVAEGFTDLGDAERNLLAGGFLHVQES